MAQAARLNLRLQKELKLLLTDPPPGASFPQLSGDSDLYSSLSSSFSSLSSIDAQIEGLEGTVYANGIFKIKIQIPERYPFQPPSVTFATPIYHPNIDTGGRICLDILNLPPKGAWQPSLNISTVLTSIGLLLSEPNPDDGLMCEASREYKYDRQAFDQKAQSMTEKYAKNGASGSSSSKIVETTPNTKTMEVKGIGMVSKHEVDEYIGRNAKLIGICRKLSWESSDSVQMEDGNREVNEVPDQYLESLTVVKRPKKEQKGAAYDCSPGHEKSCMSRQKPSLETLRVTKRDGNDKENVMPNYSPLLNSQNSSMASTSLGGPLIVNHYEQQPQQDRDSNSTSDCISITSGKPCWIGRKLTLSSKKSNVDDNVMKISGCPQSSSSQNEPNVSQKALPIFQAVRHDGLWLNEDCINKRGQEFANTKQKKLHSFGKKLSLGLLGSSKTGSDNKENTVPSQEVSFPHPKGPHSDSSKTSLTPQAGECHDQKSEICKINATRKHGISQKAKEPLGEWLRSNEKMQSNVDEGEVGNVPEADKSPIPETIVVLDSEDSDEERNVSQRSRLPLACKRLAGKWRAKA